MKGGNVIPRDVKETSDYSPRQCSFSSDESSQSFSPSHDHEKGMHRPEAHSN